jgi:hypothetical protein
MSSIQTIFLVKCLTLYNYVVETYNNVTTKLFNFYSYILDYLYGYNDIWVFIAGKHTMPIQLNSINNYVEIEWIYNNHTKTLAQNTETKIVSNPCSISWLSTNVVITNNPGKTFEKRSEYNMDDFLENLTVNVTNNIMPPLYVIFMCWCVHKKYWFTYNDDIQFNIVDEDATDLVCNLEKHNNSLYLKNDKIYLDYSPDK